MVANDKNKMHGSHMTGEHGWNIGSDDGWDIREDVHARIAVLSVQEIDVTCDSFTGRLPCSRGSLWPHVLELCSLHHRIDYRNVACSAPSGRTRSC